MKIEFGKQSYYATIYEEVPTLVENQKAFDSLTNYNRYPYIYYAELSGFNLDTVFDLEWNISNIIKNVIPITLFKELGIPFKIGGDSNFIFNTLSFSNLGQHGNYMEQRVFFNGRKSIKNIDNIKSFIDIIYLYFAVQNRLPKLSESQEDSLFNMLISSDPSIAELGVKILNRHNCLNIIIKFFLYIRYIKPWVDLPLSNIRNKKEVLWMTKGLNLDCGNALTFISDVLGEECKSIIANEFIKLMLNTNGISTDFKVKIEK